MEIEDNDLLQIVMLKTSISLHCLDKQKRFARALQIVLDGKVSLREGDGVFVESSKGDRLYQVTDDSCECSDSFRTLHCKHWIARKLVLGYLKAKREGLSHAEILWS